MFASATPTMFATPTPPCPFHAAASLPRLRPRPPLITPAEHLRCIVHQHLGSPPLSPLPPSASRSEVS